MDPKVANILRSPERRKWRGFAVAFYLKNLKRHIAAEEEEVGVNIRVTLVGEAVADGVDCLPDGCDAALVNVNLYDGCRIPLSDR